MGLLGFLGNAIWTDVKETKAALVMIVVNEKELSTKLESLERNVADHESRLRQHDGRLNALERDAKITWSPKQTPP